jgi:Flp pilus assembly protein TadB
LSGPLRRRLQVLGLTAGVTLIGVLLLPVALALLLMLVTFPVLQIGVMRLAEDRGYWKAHTEIVDIMIRAMRPGRSEAEVLAEIMTNMHFQAMTHAELRVRWWQRVGRGEQ